jgi:hypothetical protein
MLWRDRGISGGQNWPSLVLNQSRRLLPLAGHTTKKNRSPYFSQLVYEQARREKTRAAQGLLVIRLDRTKI